MDDQFYRKERKTLALKEKTLKLLKSKGFLIRFIPALIIVSIALFSDHGIIARLQLQHQKSNLTMKIQRAEAESKRLQAESRALDGDAKAIEKVAREKHGMIREGETVYKVNKK